MLIQSSAKGALGNRTTNLNKPKERPRGGPAPLTPPGCAPARAREEAPARQDLRMTSPLRQRPFGGKWLGTWMISVNVGPRQRPCRRSRGPLWGGTRSTPWISHVSTRGGREPSFVGLGSASIVPQKGADGNPDAAPRASIPYWPQASQKRLLRGKWAQVRGGARWGKLGMGPCPTSGSGTSQPTKRTESRPPWGIPGDRVMTALGNPRPRATRSWAGAHSR